MKDTCGALIRKFVWIWVSIPPNKNKSLVELNLVEHTYSHFNKCSFIALCPHISPLSCQSISSLSKKSAVKTFIVSVTANNKIIGAYSHETNYTEIKIPTNKQQSFFWYRPMDKRPLKKFLQNKIIGNWKPHRQHFRDNQSTIAIEI